MPIGDWFRSKAEPKAQPPQSGALVSYSMLYGLGDFERYNPDTLIGRQGFEIYKRMMLDEQLKAVVKFRRNAITGRGWVFKFADEIANQLSEPDQQHRIAVYREAVRSMRGSFRSALNKIMAAQHQGFSITEKLYQSILVDGRPYWGIKALRKKPFDTFYFLVDDYGELERIEQRIGSQPIRVDYDSVIHYVVNPEVDEWYGQSELREAHRDWWSKDVITKLENIFGERTAGGFVWANQKEGSLRPGTTEYADLKKILSSLTTATGLIAPKGTEINVEIPKDSQFFDRKIRRHNQGMAKALLMPEMLGVSEQGQHGGFSQAQTQLEAFMWMLDNEAADLAETLDEQLFRELGDINFGDGLYPTFEFRPLSRSLMRQVADMWKTLLDGGAVEASDTDEAYFRDMMDLPEKGEPIKQNPAPTPALPTPPDPSSSGEPGQGAGPSNKQQGEDDDETILGKKVAALSSEAFSRAQRRVDFAAIDRSSLVVERQGTDGLQDAVAAGVEYLIGRIEDDETLTTDPKAVAQIKFPASAQSALRKATRAVLNDAWQVGVDNAERELRLADRKRQFSVERFRSIGDIAARYFAGKELQIAGDVSDSARKVIQNALYQGIKYSKSTPDIVQSIYAALAKSGLLPIDLVEELAAEALGTSNPTARFNTITRTVTFEALNEARFDLFTSDLGGFVKGLQYSAILDDRTTDICRALDDVTLPQGSDRWDSLRPPNHWNALKAGTMINTSEGDKAIESVCVGDKVLTHAGRYRRVYAVMAKRNDSPGIRRIEMNTGRVLYVTDDHPILTGQGWSRADDIQVGTAVFERSDERAELPLSPRRAPVVSQAVLIHAHNRVTEIDEPLVPYEIVSHTPGVSASVDLQHQRMGNDEIGHVGVDGHLKPERDAHAPEDANHAGLMARRVSAVMFRQRDRAPSVDGRISDRVVNEHPLAVKVREVLTGFGVLCSPMVSAARRLSGFHVQRRGLRLGANADAVAFAYAGECGFAETQFALDGAQGFPVAEMFGLNQARDTSRVFGIKHNRPPRWVASTIISNDVVRYDGDVFNLGVEEDETYTAEGVVVHNCRSLLVAVTEVDTDVGVDAQPPERVAAGDVRPAEGFG